MMQFDGSLKFKNFNHGGLIIICTLFYHMYMTLFTSDEHKLCEFI